MKYSRSTIKWLKEIEVRSYYSSRAEILDSKRDGHIVRMVVVKERQTSGQCEARP
jgi:hypothetical protein